MQKSLEAGQSGNVLFLMEKPIAALMNERFILRSLSPMETMGGCAVLDSNPVPIRKELKLWTETLKENPSNKLDSLHEGQLLTSAYQNLETNTIWVKQYLQNSLFYDVIISKISFFLYGEQSISSLRLNIIFLNLLTDIFLLLFSFLFIKLLNLTHKKEVFFFTLLFAAILILNRSLHEWFWPVRFRDIPLILSLIFLLLYFINEKKNYLNLFFLGTLSAGCF